MKVNELINMFIYYDKMYEYYYFKPLFTETDVAKLYQFESLRNACERQIRKEMVYA